MDNLNRREFLGAAAGTAALPILAKSPHAKPKIPLRTLGKTGIKVSILGMGGGSQFLNATKNDDEVIELINTAIDGGITYFDCAYGYANGESLRRYGLVLGARRKEVVLTSKTAQRGRDGALREFEISLKNLKTDHLDVMQIHDIKPDEDVEKILSKDGVYRALLELREQKVIKAVGITGHASALRLRELIDRMDSIDTLLCPVNPQRDSRHYIPAHEAENRQGHFKEDLLPVAHKRGMGVIAMKTTAQGQLIGTGAGKSDVATLIRFAMSEPNVSVAIVGPGGLANMKANLITAQNFKPMSSAERKSVVASMTLRERVFGYERAGYRDMG